MSTPPTPSKILVLGAGELGSSILTSLSILSHLSPSPPPSITALIRPSTLSAPPSPTLTHLRSLTPPITLIPGDITTLTPSQLAHLFKPFTLVISALGFSAGPKSQVKITKAVLDAGVKRGSVQEVWNGQVDVRDLIRAQQQTEWVIVSTGMFTSFLFEPWFGVVEFSDAKEGEGDGEREVVVRALGGWENQVTVTTPEDIGMLTARVVYEAPRVRDRVVYTAGETVSYGRVAEIVGKLVEESGSGVRVRREVWTVEKLRQDLREDPDDNVKKYRVVFAEGKGVSWDMEKTFNVQNNIEVTDVEGFARQKFRAILNLKSER